LDYEHLFTWYPAVEYRFFKTGPYKSECATLVIEKYEWGVRAIADQSTDLANKSAFLLVAPAYEGAGELLVG